MLSSLLSSVRSFDGGHALGQANNPEQPSDGITADLDGQLPRFLCRCLRRTRSPIVKASPMTSETAITPNHIIARPTPMLPYLRSR